MSEQDCGSVAARRQLAFQLPHHVGCRDEFLADFMADVIFSFHPLPIFLLVKQMAQGRLLRESIDSIWPSHHLSARYHHTTSLHASARWSLVTEAKLVCHLPLYIRTGQTRGAGYDIPAASVGSLHILLRPSSTQKSESFSSGFPPGQQWNRFYMAERAQQARTLGLIHHPDKTEKPGSSLI